MTSTEQMTARDLFRAAYENRYTWDAQFPGYTADVTLTKDGQVFTGKVRVNADLSTEVVDVEDGEAKKIIANQLWEIAIHRVRRQFEDTHGKNAFEFGQTDDTGAVEIVVNGQAAGDHYKVRNNEVVLVHRHIHKNVVTINTFSTHDTGEGYLSHRYDSVYHDPATGARLGGRSEFEDNYDNVDGYTILTQRTIHTADNGVNSTIDLAFSNIALLKPAVV